MNRNNIKTLQAIVLLAILFLPLLLTGCATSTPYYAQAPTAAQPNESALRERDAIIARQGALILALKARIKELETTH